MSRNERPDQPLPGRGGRPDARRAAPDREPPFADRARRVDMRAARPAHPSPAERHAASFAFVAYMSTYSCPDSRMTSAITESVTARST